MALLPHLIFGDFGFGIELIPLSNISAIQERWLYSDRIIGRAPTLPCPEAYAGIIPNRSGRLSTNTRGGIAHSQGLPLPLFPERLQPPYICQKVVTSSMDALRQKAADSLQSHSEHELPRLFRGTSSLPRSLGGRIRRRLEAAVGTYHCKEWSAMGSMQEWHTGYSTQRCP